MLIDRKMHTLIGHRAEISSAQFNWDCSLIATGSMDKTVKLWDTASGVSLLLTTRGVARNLLWGGIKVLGEVQKLDTHCRIGSVTILMSFLHHKKFNWLDFGRVYIPIYPHHYMPAHYSHLSTPVSWNNWHLVISRLMLDYCNAVYCMVPRLRSLTSCSVSRTPWQELLPTHADAITSLRYSPTCTSCKCGIGLSTRLH